MLWPWSSPASLVVLKAGDITLRLPAMRDYDQWATLRRQSYDFLRPYEPRWSEKDLARRIYAHRVKRARIEAEEGTDYTFFVFLHDGQKDILVGGVTLSNIRRRAAQFANLGYWMGQRYAGQGIMSRAVALLIPFAFETLDLHRLHAAFIPNNRASRRVLEKNGFKEEGFADHYLQIDGRWADHILMGLSRERWMMLSWQKSTQRYV
ncbi:MULTISPECIES: GNAT family protein [unclassified Devosia]|uniref:GNAT family N-acetyltransferase n=1 Tax=unclassified Devosia TaxID=196773 RepID=UPI00145C8094|nr:MULTISPECIES: GNAT family protein [unclassified Devosia]MBJ6988273.1 GNAT family N-acetyltransferase [Devosia sp. MC521]QMW63215.1 GNAT family N-acetyltransferase [Devosia sp. MC521]